MSRRVKTGSAEIDRRIEDLLAAAGAAEDRDLLFDILASGVLLAGDDSDRLDLKLTAAVLAEMRVAFNAFAPYRDEPKVTIFGSARILADDPLYLAARDVAHQLAGDGWMVITGAGPGIMAAGLEGAGREKSFGVNIRLPFEQEANEFILGDTKLISMKYFFTRKLELVKESQGFICLPGGFGTLDETFELLTLQQTGKSVPTPIVFLDEPGGSYWTGWRAFVLDHVVAGGYVAAEDLSLVTITDDEQVAVDAVLGFYRNYRSIRWVGKTLVVRLVQPPDRRRARRPERRVRRPPAPRQRDPERPAPPRGGGRRRPSRPGSADAGVRHPPLRSAPRPHRAPEQPRLRPCPHPSARRPPSGLSHSVGGPGGVIGLLEEVHGLVHGPSGPGEATFVDGQFLAPGVDRLLQALDGQIGHLLADRLQAVTDVIELSGHGRQFGSRRGAFGRPDKQWVPSPHRSSNEPRPRRG